MGSEAEVAEPEPLELGVNLAEPEQVEWGGGISSGIGTGGTRTGGTRTGTGIVARASRIGTGTA